LVGEGVHAVGVSDSPSLACSERGSIGLSIAIEIGGISLGFGAPTVIRPPCPTPAPRTGAASGSYDPSGPGESDQVVLPVAINVCEEGLRSRRLLLDFVHSPAVEAGGARRIPRLKVRAEHGHAAGGIAEQQKFAEQEQSADEHLCAVDLVPKSLLERYKKGAPRLSSVRIVQRLFWVGFMHF
jgi:hypothetical protein